MNGAGSRGSRPPSEGAGSRAHARPHHSLFFPRPQQRRRAHDIVTEALREAVHDPRESLAAQRRGVEQRELAGARGSEARRRQPDEPHRLIERFNLGGSRQDGAHELVAISIAKEARKLAGFTDDEIERLVKSTQRSQVY